MQNIPGLLDGDDNQGSLRSLLFISMEEVTFKHVVNAEGQVDLQQYVDQDVIFNHLNFTLDSASFKEEEELSANGSYFKQVIECRVPKDYSYRRKQMEDMENFEYMIIGLGFTGRSFIVGELDEDMVPSGMRLKTKFTTDDKFKDQVSYTLNFYKESASRAKACFNFSLVDITETTPSDIIPLDEEPPGGAID